jgi:hypothetical protein
VVTADDSSQSAEKAQKKGKGKRADKKTGKK